MSKSYEAWWLPAHVEYRHVAETEDGDKSWFSSKDKADSWLDEKESDEKPWWKS